MIQMIITCTMHIIYNTVVVPYTILYNVCSFDHRQLFPVSQLIAPPHTLCTIITPVLHIGCNLQHLIPL